MSKQTRWTIYTTIIVGVIVGGWYLTATERPDRYTPRDQYEAMGEVPDDHAQQRSAEGAEDAGYAEDNGATGTHQTQDPTDEPWTATIAGEVVDTLVMETDSEGTLYSMELQFDEPRKASDHAPSLTPPTPVVSTRESLLETLDGLPEEGDYVIVEVQSSSPAPTLLQIESIQWDDAR